MKAFIILMAVASTAFSLAVPKAAGNNLPRTRLRWKTILTNLLPEHQNVAREELDADDIVKSQWVPPQSKRAELDADDIVKSQWVPPSPPDERQRKREELDADDIVKSQWVPPQSKRAELDADDIVKSQWVPPKDTTD